jgi:Rrf2 family nitric oxide-sensitive transcriptional repressor
MRLTAYTDYTLRVLMYLAIDGGRLATIPEIADAYGISRNHLMKVVHRLALAGLVETVRGKGGGLRLARPPGAIRIGAVARAAEGDGDGAGCLSRDGGGCAIAPVCRLSGAIAESFDAFYGQLDRYTLADLVAPRRALRAILIGMPAPARRSAARAA